MATKKKVTKKNCSRTRAREGAQNLASKGAPKANVTPLGGCLNLFDFFVTADHFISIRLQTIIYQLLSENEELAGEHELLKEQKI